jgi:hypothetical protein
MAFTATLEIHAKGEGPEINKWLVRAFGVGVALILLWMWSQAKVGNTEVFLFGVIIIFLGAFGLRMIWNRKGNEGVRRGKVLLMFEPLGGVTYWAGDWPKIRGWIPNVDALADKGGKDEIGHYTLFPYEFGEIKVYVKAKDLVEAAKKARELF